MREFEPVLAAKVYIKLHASIYMYQFTHVYMKMSLIAHVVTMKYLRHFQNTSTVTSLFPVISQNVYDI